MYDGITRIEPNDVLTLWTFLTGWAAASIWLEQRYKWAAALTSSMLALLGAMFLANIKVVPIHSPAYDFVWDYLIPIAVPLLLFDADIRRIWRESGRTFIAFHFAVLGTLIGTIVATLLLRSYIPEIKGVLAMLSASYIGGSINLAAMRSAFGVSPEMTGATIVADNFLMAIYFFVLMGIPQILFFRRKYSLSHTLCSTSEKDGSQQTNAASFWGRKEISLLDIASNIAVAIAIVTFSTKAAHLFSSLPSIPHPLRIFLEQKYLLITTLTVALTSLFPGFFKNIRGSREIGSFFIHIFFVVIGVSASISMILRHSPLLFVFAAIIIVINLFVTLALGKLFRFDLEELLISCNATIGGPTTAAAMAIAKGWSTLIVPALLVGIWGYVLGNHCAIGLVHILERMQIIP